jgi:hypothetical protein
LIISDLSVIVKRILTDSEEDAHTPRQAAISEDVDADEAG